MLPFLKNKNANNGGISMVYRKPDEKAEGGEVQDDHALEAAASDLHKAMQAGDIKAIAKAFRAAFEILESQPHDEYEQDNEEEKSE
jgi:hypothetical protein